MGTFPQDSHMRECDTAKNSTILPQTGRTALASEECLQVSNMRANSHCTPNRMYLYNFYTQIIHSLEHQIPLYRSDYFAYTSDYNPVYITILCSEADNA